MVKRSKLMTAVLAALLATGFATAFAAAYKEGPVAKGGTLKGVVKYGGDMSKANQKDTTNKDPDACGADRMKPELLVDAGTKGLQDAVVYIKKIDAGKAWSPEQKKVELDQKKCAFDHHVTLVAEGGEVVFKNSDTVLHNISATAVMNKAFNEGVGANKEMSKKFDKSEFIKLTCSVHPWMNATIVVMANPYYVVTNEKGEFTLAEIPAGKYSIIVQHQELGKVDKRGTDVEIKEGETKTQDFEFK